MILEALQKSGNNLSLEEIEAFHRSLKKCPKCDSNEGFWLTANRQRSYVQCKYCGAILEIVEVFRESDKIKEQKGVFRRIRP
jgi:translation initiation factor 2 beta subunit (eIF-2beta)/eIF-5